MGEEEGDGELTVPRPGALPKVEPLPEVLPELEAVGVLMGAAGLGGLVKGSWVVV